MHGEFKENKVEYMQQDYSVRVGHVSVDASKGAEDMSATINVLYIGESNNVYGCGRRDKGSLKNLSADEIMDLHTILGEIICAFKLDSAEDKTASNNG